MTSVRRTRSWAMVGVVAAVLSAAALLSFGLGHRDALGSPALVARRAPDFALPGLDGGQQSAVHLSDLRGHVVVVNFWASWCAECRTEQGALNRTWQRFRDAGVVMVGVDFEDDTGDARAYVASAGATYPVVVDSNSNTALDYGLRGVPETYVIDPRGRLVDRIIGPADEKNLADHITALLPKGT